MTTSDTDPYAPIKDAWHLYQVMTEELAREYSRTALDGGDPDETWTGLPGKVEATKAALYAFAGPGATRKDRWEHRQERFEVEGLNEILDQTHEALVALADAGHTYLRLENEAEQAIADGGSPDASGLQVARAQYDRSREMLRQCRATLAYRIENLADETGSGLFTPNDAE